MPVSEITPSAHKLDKIVNRIEEGDIKIPAFQRGFVWDQQQVIELLDSIYHDYPIGSVLLWNSMEKLKATRNVGGFKIPDRDDSYPVNYVLDGQQRLSTIYAVFCSDRTPEFDPGQYKVDPTIFDIYFDLDSKEFRSADNLIQGNSSFRLKDLFDFNSFFKAIEALSSEHKKAAQELHLKFNNYEVPIVTITKRDKREVGIIFERINNTGTKLTTLDLMVAWTWKEDFHLREEMNDLLEKLEAKGFSDIPEKIILQCLSSIVRESSTTRTILDLTPEEVHDNFPKLTESLEKTIDFLSTELNISNRDFLPHAQQIISLAYFFSRKHIPDVEQTKTLKEWFWKTAFSKRYAAQTDEKVDSDIAFFKDVLNGINSGISRYAYTLTKDVLIKQKFTKNHPYVRAFLLLLAQNNPLNLVNGNKIDLGRALSKYNYKEYHHIFPRAFLKKKGTKEERVNSMCNFCFLPADSNKVVSDRAPSDYIFNLVPKGKFSEILSSNLIPLRKEIYEQDDFVQFLDLRAQLILQFLDSQLV
jgi:hypothetical protein